MSDNVAITAGSGTSVAADDIGSVYYQRVKLALGADGTAVDAVAGTGVMGTGVQRVTIATDDPVITAINASNAQLPTALGSQAAATSLGVTASTEDIARTGIITETAPATDTASSGLNGRLQRIAQRLTSWLAAMTATSATDTNRLPTAEPDSLGITPAGLTGTGTFFTQDMTGYSSGSVQVVSAGGGTNVVSFFFSDDNVNFLAVPFLRADSSGATAPGTTATIALGQIYRFPRLGKYCRVTLSTYGSGTVTVVANFYKSPLATTSAYVGGIVSTSGQISHDSPVSSGVPVMTAGVANDYGSDQAAVSADEDVCRISVTRQGNVRTVQEYSYNHISTAATTVVKSGAGILHNISVNTKGTVASTITIYDNTAGSGTVIGVINSLDLSGSFILDVGFATGLTIVTTGTVAPDLTVSYK